MGIQSARISTYSVTADHALRALLLIARTDGRQVPAREVAAAIGAPTNYTGKTLNALARAGLLVSERGQRGGFTLAKRPDRVTVADVMDVFSEPRANPQCLLGRRTCTATNGCGTHRRWSALLAAAREPFQTTTLSQLLDDS